MTDIFFILGSFVLLFTGGEGLICGSVATEKMKLSTLPVSTVISKSVGQARLFLP